jgi:2-oxoisovalerate dehydrogenase E1 component alpha subunit
MQSEISDEVRKLQKQAESSGVLPTQGFDRIGSMFEDVFEHTPWHLQEQRELALGEAREFLGHDVE